MKTMMFGMMMLTATACMQRNAMADTPAGVSKRDTATEIVFVEQEKDIAPYQTRVLVTAHYLRFDDGAGARDFILYDRKRHVIYRVDSSEHTIMSVSGPGLDIKPPFPLKLSEKDLGPMKGAPRIGGHTPVHYEFSANGQLCYDVIAVKGLMPDALDALREFRKVLAADSTHTFNQIPADMHNACDMARSTFAPNRHLSHGFPIQEWRKDGYSRHLKNYTLDYQVDPGLFELPKDYQHFKVQDFREGKVRLQG